MFFRPLAEYRNCKLIATPAKYDYKPVAYGFQKNSPYLGLFNYFLKEMEEKGAMAKIRAKYENHRQVCPDMGGKPLGFESCFMAFLALLWGIGMCLILMLSLIHI